MKYIKDYKIDCDYACYFNGNLQYNSESNTDSINLDKLNVSIHCCHSENSDYIMGGLFIGNSNIFYKMCDYVTKMVEYNLMNNTIPEWYDETLLNEWVKNNKSLVNKLHKLCSYYEFNKSMSFAVIETIDKDRRTNKRYYS